MFEISKRINKTPVSVLLFFLLVFFLPFQERYHKLLKGFTQFAFKGQYLPSYFLGRSLEFYVTDLLMLGILFIGLRGPIKKLFWDKSQKYMSLFLLFSLLSIFFSSANGMGWPYYRWLQLALPIGVYFVMSQKKGMLQTCFWILLFTSLVQCIVTVDQYLLQHSIGLKHLGEQTIAYSFSPQISVFTRHRWIFDKWLGIQALSEHILRPFGTFPHPNVLGAFIGMSFFSSSFLYLKTKKKWIAPLLSFQLFALALTFSRGAIFGVIGSFCFFLLLLGLAKENWKKLILPFLIGALFSSVVLHEQYVERGGVVGESPSSQVSDSMRVYYQKAAVAMVKERPWIGHGFGQYLTEVERFIPERAPYEIQRVHNVYLLIFAESGVFALLAFVAYFLSLLYWVWKRGIDLAAAALLSIGALFLFSGCVDYFWIELQHGRLMLFLTCGLAFQLLQNPVGSSRREHKSQEEACSPSC